MIKYIKGNLLHTDCSVILHGCNAQGVMGSGVALQIKERWPYAFTEYRLKYDQGKLYLGGIFPVYIQKENKLILNAITQMYYGRAPDTRFVSYDAVDAIMKDVSGKYEQVAMPKIGAGLGGGDWSVIEAIINANCKDNTILVYDPEMPEPINLNKKHPSHRTRGSDASSFDEICVLCGATDEVPGGWGKLAFPCSSSNEVRDEYDRKKGV